MWWNFYFVASCVQVTAILEHRETFNQVFPVLTTTITFPVALTSVLLNQKRHGRSKSGTCVQFWGILFFHGYKIRQSYELVWTSGHLHPCLTSNIEVRPGLKKECMWWGGMQSHFQVKPNFCYVRLRWVVVELGFWQFIFRCISTSRFHKTTNNISKIRN